MFKNQVIQSLYSVPESSVSESSVSESSMSESVVSESSVQSPECQSAWFISLLVTPNLVDDA